MDCQQVEDLISLYIENELEAERHGQISLHLEHCSACRQLKEKVEDLLTAFPDLEEEVPFFLKNRLYYIPESLEETDFDEESKFYYLRWVAAVIGTFVLFLNLFYFTNIYPPANRIMHNAVSDIKTFAVDTGAFIQKVAESRGMILFSLLKKEPDSDSDADSDETESIDVEKNINESENGGKNDGKQTGKN